MSDIQQNPDWWLGADGKWYPPVAPVVTPSALEVEPDLGQTEPDVEKPKRGRKRLVVGAMAVVVVVAVVGFALTRGGGGKQTIVGGVTLIDSGIRSGTNGHGVTCHGTGGYSDMTGGAGVTVRDGTGKILATTTLSDGSAGSQSDTCVFAYVVEVPKADFYTFEVSHRGQLSYSYDDLKAAAFVVSATLGR